MVYAPQISDAPLFGSLRVSCGSIPARVPAADTEVRRRKLFVARRYQPEPSGVWGTDVFVAPFNFVMRFPNFVLRVLAVFLDSFGARKAAQWLLRRHLGLPMTVQKTPTAKLMVDLLDLPANPEDATDHLRHLVACAAREPVRCPCYEALGVIASS